MANLDKAVQAMVLAAMGIDLERMAQLQFTHLVVGTVFGAAALFPYIALIWWHSPLRRYTKAPSENLRRTASRAYTATR